MSAQEQDTLKTFDPTFAHTVYFWFKHPDSQKDGQLFEASLQRFMANSKYAKTKYVGKPPKAVRDVVDDTFTYCLIVTFESAEAQQKYQDEPAHLAFVDECKDLWEKVIVYDSKGLQP
ncbi:Stress responsive alpha-beta barrel domain-containing protein [Croceitalea dokdonensis DOKDO 023]|uniref:Stress responsive alpha-beta barrel domain-containing protein n=1 Tax=Croceitalea dokdonensis DOKDO 023 TaxID=1300341 RepID=A0A0P7ATH0_9FLAO|nr:Dabb family protein [Croceitalea dokdonensis]KPM31178.1 Stress responsive alpha-beta barrel domain-containing protein [Croceitalea dokdonensis DOKDO 023]